jgi:hypothetical protein
MLIVIPIKRFIALKDFSRSSLVTLISPPPLFLLLHEKSIIKPIHKDKNEVL